MNAIRKIVVMTLAVLLTALLVGCGGTQTGKIYNIRNTTTCGTFTYTEKTASTGTAVAYFRGKIGDNYPLYDTVLKYAYTKSGNTITFTCTNPGQCSVLPSSLAKMTGKIDTNKKTITFDKIGIYCK